MTIKPAERHNGVVPRAIWLGNEGETDMQSFDIEYNPTLYRTSASQWCAVLVCGAGLFLSSAETLAARPGGPPACTVDNITGPCRFIRTIRNIKADHDKYVSERSTLWIEKEYLTREEATHLHGRIDKGIRDVESTLGVKFAADVYGRERIEFFVHSARRPSHTITAYWPRRFLHPVIFLTYAKGRRTPYLHEIVHIVAWDWHALWLKEGLAVVLNDRLGGYRAFPNFGRSLDDMAREFDGAGSYPAATAMDLIGENGVPEFDNRKVRRIFYIFAGSFVAYLERKIGLPVLMKIYSEEDTAAAILRLTGKPVGQWKAEWRREFY